MSLNEFESLPHYRYYYIFSLLQVYMWVPSGRFYPALYPSYYYVSSYTMCPYTSMHATSYYL